MNEIKLLCAKELCKEYTQGHLKVRALDGITFDIDRGEFTILSGPSGSGKTTTLNIIGGLDNPTAGSVYIEGRDISSLTRAKLSELRRDRIGFVFQAYNLIATLTAFENAEMVLALQGVPKALRKEKVMNLLESVGLGGMENRRPDELSGGQQQRVAIARAIAHEPAVVLADEPTANVDSKTADALLDLMSALNRDKGVTFIFSTHDPRVIARGRRIIRMCDGKIESDDKQL